MDNCNPLKSECIPDILGCRLETPEPCEYILDASRSPNRETGLNQFV